MKNTSILTDVTTYISAQEYLLSKCMRRNYEDPFALQAYSELTQTILLYDDIYVPHPIYLHGSSKEDFGKEPELLIELFDRGIVKPLNLKSSISLKVEKEEENLLLWLQEEGAELLNSYLNTMQKGEEKYLPMNSSFKGVTLSRLRDWAQYQHAKVRSIDGHHPSRIPTKNGIEEDSIGNFARSFSYIFRKKMSYLGEEQSDYLVATILRGLRYRIRANIAKIPYQPHVMRRDFVLRFDFQDSRVSEDYTQYVINLIRGIPKAITSHARKEAGARVQLLNFTVPLLGGKLWTEDDIDLHYNSWIELIADRIEEYRDKTRILRDSILDIKDEENATKLEREFEIIQERLLEACGLKNAVLSETDKALIEGGLATVCSTPSLPIIQGLLITVTSIVKRNVFSGATPQQQFVYKEFLRGWKKTR